MIPNTKVGSKVDVILGKHYCYKPNIGSCVVGVWSRSKYELHRLLYCKLNPTLDGLQELLLWMGGGTWCPPLITASEGHFWVQMK